jgi:hypothetical protein
MTTDRVRPILPLMRSPPLRAFAAILTPALATAIAGGAVALVLAAGAVAASGASKRFFDAHRGVGVEAPPGWTLSQHTGYPNILVVLLHPDGSRISVAAAPTTAKDAPALAEESRAGMGAQKLAVTRVAPGPRGGMLVDARATQRDEIVRQLYLVRPLDGGVRQAIVITLITRPDRLAVAGPAFDWVLGRMTLEAPLGRDDEATDGGRRSESGSAGERAADKNGR